MKYKKIENKITFWKQEIQELIKKKQELNKRIEKEIPELTCCGDEIIGWVKDYRICPTCKENI